MGEPWPIFTQLQRSVHPAHLDLGSRSHRQGHRCTDAGASETTAAQDALRHRSVRDARRQSVVARRSRMPARILSGQDPSNPLAGAMANHSSDLQPLLAAWGVDYDPTKVIGDLDLGLEVRTNASSAPRSPHRHPGIAPRRDESEGCGDGFVGVHQLSTAGFLSRAPVPRPLRAFAAEFGERGAYSRVAIQCVGRSCRPA